MIDGYSMSQGTTHPELDIIRAQFMRNIQTIQPVTFRPSMAMAPPK